MEKIQISGVTIQDLNHPEVNKELRALNNIVKSCFGPNGRLKIIQVKTGCHMTVTSSASRLFTNLPLHHPIVKLIIAAIQAHIKLHSDFGLYGCFLCTQLILDMTRTGFNRLLCSKFLQKASTVCLDHLLQARSQRCCQLDLNFESLCGMLALVQTILGSKAGCLLDSSDVRHFACLTVRAFLHSLPDAGSESAIDYPVLFCCIDGKAASNSHIVEGILVDAFEIWPDTPFLWKWTRNERDQIKVFC